MATPAEPSPAETPADPMRPPQALVKLYMLNDETTWDVVGTGFVSILNPDGSLCSLSRAEDSGAGVGDGAPDTVAMDATSTAADENVNPPQDGDEAAAAGGTAAAGEAGDDAGENASGSDGSSDGDGGGDGGDDGGSEAPKPGRPDIPPESTSAYRLVVLANDADAVMLDTNVHSEDVYQLQQNTLIVWNEPQVGGLLFVDVFLFFSGVGRDSRNGRCTNSHARTCTHPTHSPTHALTDSQPFTIACSPAAVCDGPGNLVSKLVGMPGDLGPDHGGAVPAGRFQPHPDWKRRHV